MSKNAKTDIAGHDWKEVTVNKDKESLYADSYQNFGWELVNTSAPYPNALTVVLKFRRDTNIRNKAELEKLEKQFESGLRQIQKIERKTRNSVMIPALTSGIGGIALLGWAIYSFISGSVQMGVISIILAFAGLVLGSFFGFSKERGRGYE